MRRLTAGVAALFVSSAVAEPPHSILDGVRLVEDGSRCAGWHFKSAAVVLRYDEAICSRSGQPSLTTRPQWLDAERVLLIESVGDRSPPERPPRVWLYRVSAVDATHVRLIETWLGWGAGGSEVPQNYRRRAR